MSLVQRHQAGGQKTVIVNQNITKRLAEIFQEVNIRTLMFHHNNASFHTARLVDIQISWGNKIKVIGYLPSID